MKPDSKIYIAGHKGLVGSAVERNLRSKGFNNIITRTHADLDLCEQQKVRDFFAEEEPEYVIICAAKVGGIVYNKSYPADFLYENIMISANVVQAAADHGARKLLYLGSSCIYPKLAPQPIKEEYLMTGPLEPTNEGYALAKIAGLKLCEKYFEQYGKKFISVMPTNLYGPGDNYHPEHSHVIPGILRRFHYAAKENQPEVVIWGTGSPRREFLHVDDLAEGLYILMEKYEEPETINIGTGLDISILELSKIIRDIVGYKGELKLDPSKPDGTPRKVLDVTRMKNLGWEPSYELKEGLEKTYNWVLENHIFE